MSAVMNALIISAEGTNTVTISEKNPDNKAQTLGTRMLTAICSQSIIGILSILSAAGLMVNNFV